MVEGDGQFLGALRAFFQQPLGEPREAAEIYKYGAGAQGALQLAVAIIFLDEMRQKMSHNRVKIDSGAKVRFL
jgi:hypothetical protein